MFVLIVLIFKGLLLLDLNGLLIFEVERVGVKEFLLFGLKLVNILLFPDKVLFEVKNGLILLIFFLNLKLYYNLFKFGSFI